MSSLDRRKFYRAQPQSSIMTHLSEMCQPLHNFIQQILFDEITTVFKILKFFQREIWEIKAVEQAKYIRTACKPEIFWKPRIMDADTKELQKLSKEKTLGKN